MARKSQTNVESVKETTPEIVTENKTFSSEELIPCTSVTVGNLFMEGDKSGTLYTWYGYGDITEVEYRDLKQAIKKRSNYIFNPTFIVSDADFVAQDKELEKFYASLYTMNDLKEIMSYPVNQMISAIESLPTSVKETFKGLVSSAIDSGEFDSINKIKAIDKIFDTQMLLKVTQ